MSATAVLNEHETDPGRKKSPSRKEVRIVATDGYVLSADRFTPKTSPRGLIVIAGAIGAPQRFYSRFAEYARDRGYAVMTFDYRGIARSAPGTLEGFRMDLRDWARLDLAAVIEANANEADDLGVPLYVVAHSFGGQAFGMLPNHSRVRAVFSYGTGAGWLGWMPLAERIRVWGLWNVAGPLLTRWSKYLSWSKLGMGEDLPLDVYREWRNWCSRPNYFFDDPKIGKEMRELFHRVQTPILAVSATDDRWSPPRSRDAFFAGYTHAHVSKVDLQPSVCSVKSLGHMGYFRPQASVLWADALKWLESV